MQAKSPQYPENLICPLTRRGDSRNNRVVGSIRVRRTACAYPRVHNLRGGRAKCPRSLFNPTTLRGDTMAH